MLEHLLNHPKYIHPQIIIYSDSMTSLELLDQITWPSSYTIQHLIEHIYKCIWVLKTRNFIKKIFIKKVKSHGNCTWHNKVDKIANTTAKQTKLNPNHNKLIPYYIHIQKLKQAIHTLQNKDWQQYRLQKNHKTNYLESTFLNHDHNIYKYLNFFHYHNRQIIANLITNQTKTNEYYHRFKFKNPSSYNNGYCNKCDMFLETIDHIVYICPEYTQQRQQFRNTITTQFPIFQTKSLFGYICNLFFPRKNKQIIQSIKQQPYQNYSNKQN